MVNVEVMEDKERLRLIETGDEWQQDLVPIFAGHSNIKFLVDLEVYVGRHP
jgi:hypothetical protein